MMLTHWMLYMLVVSVALAALALAADNALRLYGRPTRWIWATSLVGSLGLPVLAFLRASAPTAVADVGAAFPLSGLPAGSASVTPPATSAFWRTWLDALTAHGDDVLLAVWLLTTTLLIAYALLSYLRLRRQRQRWAEGEVDGLRVLVSESAGPAVVGLRRPRIVLPVWVLEEPEARRRLIVAHEAEHVAAGDPRLLASACGALLLTPWNPLVWWQLRRLRLASELDCDARVLRHGADLRGYAGLLLDVGERFGRAPLAAAFAEPRSVLARRLAALTARKPARRALRAALGAALALGIVAVAGATPVPERPSWTVSQEPTVTADVGPITPQAPQVVLKVDDAGNYLVDGKAVPECAQARRGTPEGMQACQAALTAAIRRALPASGGEGSVLVQVDPTRLVHDLAEAMEFVRAAGLSRVEFDQGEKVAALPEDRSVPQPPTSAAQLARIELEVLPAGRFSVAGVSLTAGQLGPFLRNLYQSRTDKSIYFKVNEWARYADAVQAGAAAKAAGLQGSGSSYQFSLVPPPPPPPPPDSPPPGVQVFTPYTVAPELINRDVVVKALADNYPPLLKQAGVGGTVLVWALVNEQGAVPSALLAQTSGRTELDDAGAKVTRMMRFTPARNKDEVVKVWIKLPIVFKTSADGKSVLPAAPGKVPEAVPAKIPEDVPAKIPEDVPTPPGKVHRVTAQDIAAGPTFTPYTQAPELANRETVRKALQENYPPLLRAAGIGGTIVIWALIDEQGGVPKTMVKKTSGRAELDSAALNVARVMRFVPGKNGPDVVKVWVQLPIVFRTESDKAPAAKDTAGMGALNQKLQKDPVAGLKRDSHYGIPGLPDGYTPPQALNRDEVKKVYDSVYPPAARNTGQVAWLLLVIDASGKVASSRLLVRSGDPALDKAAEAVGKVARFQPALDGSGKPAAVKVGYPVAARSQNGAVY